MRIDLEVLNSKREDRSSSVRIPRERRRGTVRDLEWTASHNSECRTGTLQAIRSELLLPESLLVEKKQTG